MGASLLIGSHRAASCLLGYCLRLNFYLYVYVLYLIDLDRIVKVILLCLMLLLTSGRRAAARVKLAGPVLTTGGPPRIDSNPIIFVKVSHQLVDLLLVLFKHRRRGRHLYLASRGSPHSEDHLLIVAIFSLPVIRVASLFFLRGVIGVGCLVGAGQTLVLVEAGVVEQLEVLVGHIGVSCVVLIVH